MRHAFYDSPEYRKKMREKRLGKDNPSYKNGKFIYDGYVYILCPEHPHALNGEYMAEHRLVMEKHLGIILNPNDIVHHINGNRSDNRIENLQLTTRGNHNVIHKTKKEWRKTE